MNVYVLLIFAMILWGMYPIFTHYFIETIDPLFLASIAVFLSSFPFIIKLLIRKEIKKLLSQKVIVTLLPVALFGGLGYVFLFYGTSLTTGTNTGILLQVEPIYALLLGIIIFREKFGIHRFIGTLIMVVGAIFIVYKGSVSPSIGDILVLFTTLMWQISHTFAKKLLDSGLDPSIILGGRQFIAGLTLIIFFISSNNSYTTFLTNPSNIKIGLFLGLYQGLVTFIWYMVIKKIPVSKASSFLPITAVVAMLGSIFFLKETLNSQQLIGFILIFSGMIWLTKINQKPTK